MAMKKKSSKVKVDEWATISAAFVDAQFAAADAFAEFEVFKSRAPRKGGQKAYDKWHDANSDEFYALERATVEAALDYVEAHAAECRYFARQEA